MGSFFGNLFYAFEFDILVKNCFWNSRPALSNKLVLQIEPHPSQYPLIDYLDPAYNDINFDVQEQQNLSSPEENKKNNRPLFKKENNVVSEEIFSETPTELLEAISNDEPFGSSDEDLIDDPDSQIKGQKNSKGPFFNSQTLTHCLYMDLNGTERSHF